MAHLLFVKDRTARNGQQIGDFVLAYDYEPTATEKELFEHVEMPGVTATQVTEKLQMRLDEKKQYPKFPFNRASLKAADVTALKSGDIAILDKVALKVPTGDVEPIAVEK